MGSDDHHPAALQLDAWSYPQPWFAQQTAVTPAQTQLRCLQRRGQASQVEKTHTIDAALEGLAIWVAITEQLDTRVEEAPEPAALDAHFQHQGFVTLQRGVGTQHATLPGWP